ncbi:CTR copper uptake transporter [Fomitopsis serialis]|uniref:CTR copper uptake transporter n=1 Tax=Fomitopsis serialis TaxID=139415 RepID=UPI002008D166|nr:CTR copper uptake transporter [Neoantrodia serialis]KAH9913205.1 CTR copper uptake transporter [Neoantrodia serialis]
MCYLVCLCALFAPVAQAASNGMDMSMDGAMDLASGNMLTYLHFTPGDILWFQGWVPGSAGAMVGACIGLFLLAMVERWIAAARAVMQAHWAQRARVVELNTGSNASLPTTRSSAVDEKRSTSSLSVPVLHSTLPRTIGLRSAAPFILKHELPRGILLMVQVALNYAFMLAVMTFQLGFIFSLIVGLGVGEMLFGRFASHIELVHL